MGDVDALDGRDGTLHLDWSGLHLVTRLPGETIYGDYPACFADPDGQLWEVAYNPGFTLAEDGSLILPDF